MENERIGDWIETWNGVKFYPLDPREEEINIDDIAHALSFQCRFAGHCLDFYSVAEHCCHMHDKIDEEFKFAALMHDASEAYLVDVPRPIKRYLTNYIDIEQKLEKIIFTKYGLPFPFHPTVKEYDNRILFDEKAALMNNASDWGWSMDPLGVDIQCWTPARAEEEFKIRFYRHKGNT